MKWSEKKYLSTLKHYSVGRTFGVSKRFGFTWLLWNLIRKQSYDNTDDRTCAIDKIFRKLTIRVCNYKPTWVLERKSNRYFFIILKTSILKIFVFIHPKSTPNTIIFTGPPHQYKHESIASSSLSRNYSIHLAYVFEQSFVCMVIRFVNAPSRSRLYVCVRIP